jgi:hypothetical protein
MSGVRALQEEMPFTAFKGSVSKWMARTHVTAAPSFGLLAGYSCP